MKKRILGTMVFGVLALALPAAAFAQTPTATPTASPTATATATATASPTGTASPTSTASPTGTATASPTATPAGGVQAGLGGTADDSNSAAMMLGIAGTAIALATGSALLIRQRRANQ